MQLEVGAIVEGKVTSITKFGAFIALPENKTGRVHISEIAPVYVKEIRDHLTEGQMVKVRVIGISEDGKISLSIKKAVDQQQPRRRPDIRAGEEPPEWTQKRQDNLSFEDMMNKFKTDSDEKMSDLKRTMESKRGSYQRRGAAKF